MLMSEKDRARAEFKLHVALKKKHGNRGIGTIFKREREKES